MLPATIVADVRRQVLFYLGATFDFRDKTADHAFNRFLEDPDHGLFKGPWVQLSRPYRLAEKDAPLPFDIISPFHPFLHQWRAWMRLTSKSQRPKPTLVTSGTGSGKTECFLYPILDHCVRAKQKGQKGIKAIILYPMNALAADQEKRFAKAVWGDPVLKAANVRIGTYTGRYDPSDPGAGKNTGERLMGPDHGISNQEVLQDAPPDVLLTNYKMLDFLLMRPQDQALWRYNEPAVLRYLVLDELHTYDGAQGADVGCLIRRLKERMAIPKGELCVVGTSATIEVRDDGRGAHDAAEDGKERLARFASKLFEEDIPTDAIIAEDRLEAEEIAVPSAVNGLTPLPNAADCLPLDGEDADAYTIRQADVWNGPQFDPQLVNPRVAWSLALGAWLKRDSIFGALLSVFRDTERRREDPLLWRDLVSRLTRADFRFQDAALSDEDRHNILASFFALIARAREERSGRAVSLVPTQVQLWIRELRRLGRVVSVDPEFAWLDEPVAGIRALPAFHCSECGDSGWIALHNPDEDSKILSQGVQGIQLVDDPQAIYRAYFGYKGQRNQYVVILSPWTEQDGIGEQESLPSAQDYLCAASLVLRKGPGPCPLTGDGRVFRVKASQETRKLDSGAVIGDQRCPSCGSRVGIFIIGSQSATLSSVAIDEMFCSILNSDPKLLAFTDSVQDASHRAGFFSSRTYQFTFRTALQHIIDDAGSQGLPLEQVGDSLLCWWGQPLPGRPGSVGEVMAALMPPDLHDYQPYKDYRDAGFQGEAPAKLRRDFETRLWWEATSEFGLMQTHGRTMERSGSSCVAWDRERIRLTVESVRERLPKISSMFVDLSDDSLALWIYGILYRFRERGALYHPFLDALARQNFWGKYPFGRVVPGRETYPSAGRFRPHLLVTQAQREHDHILAPSRGGQAPWHILWTRRALGRPGADEVSVLDLLRNLLDCGTAAGLLRKLHQDGSKEYYAISSSAARLSSDTISLACSQTERPLVRPADESRLWEGAPSMEYYADLGRYQPTDWSPRQRYYQARYRKGALRRVISEEHTGLLATKERERVEKEFTAAAHLDDTNVLACTSTLEMGIDIGDLSSTMLCSIPPSTASYLQRVGRAGRATGTSLIISIVNQRPHDLFFFGRPGDILKGRVDPPGCWLDASAVLVRQYLAFCFDTAVKAKILTELPRSGRQLVEDIDRTDGNIPRMLEWVTKNETELRSRFLNRFQIDILPDTRQRFEADTSTEVLRQRIERAVREYDQQNRDLINARKRLQGQLKEVGEEEEDAKKEIDQELRIIKGRMTALDRVSSLEILTDYGLLPNYAFPERGVRFHGAVYNKYRGNEQEPIAIDVVRGAGTAIRELAPSNFFYTHSRKFEIQQIVIGNPQQPLIEEWAICGNCGHMRRVAQMNRPEAGVACPQCGHDADSFSQSDRGQHRKFLEFPLSQALSYMEQYESLSGDKDDERERGYYQVLRSFDQTAERASGAVGDTGLPFGIEYRGSLILREVNAGYGGQPGVLKFGPGQDAPDPGFLVCPHCGVVVPTDKLPGDVEHRRSCQWRRRDEKLKQQGKTGVPCSWESVYLYRELRSEAIRLLLPLTDDEDLETLRACIYLGLRLRFEGDPAYLLVVPQILPEPSTGIDKHYLVLMDAVPGGTGYLKALYQEQDSRGRPGEGVMQVLRLARNALETCSCRKLKAQKDDTDGCYRCIRTYHLQYNADRISRERGIKLLNDLIAAGEKRVEQEELATIKSDALFGSVLEKRFVDKLREFVEAKQGTWEATMIRGAKGFRFALPGSGRLWELELQPLLGAAQGVMTASQPDFLLRTDDSKLKPIAIFTDGFEFHCNPNNRLADDLRKRRSILQSGQYHVWSVTWEDLENDKADHPMVCHDQVVDWIHRVGQAASANGQTVPAARTIVRNGFEQLKAFLECPHAPGWGQLAGSAVFFPLHVLATQAKRFVMSADLQAALESWRTGQGFADIPPVENGEWVYNQRASLTQDIVAYIRESDLFSNRRSQLVILGRLGDSEAECTGSDFLERWRRFLACLNLYQFCENFVFWTSTEARTGEAPDLPWQSRATLPPEWQDVLDAVTSSLKVYIPDLAEADVPIPAVEHFNDDVSDDCFAEMAWPDLETPVAVLVGDQADFGPRWKAGGWAVLTSDELQREGVRALIDLLRGPQKGS